MSTAGPRPGWVAAGVLAAALVVTFAFRLPCPRDDAPGPAGDVTIVTGPDRATVRQSIDRAVLWLEQTRVLPPQEGWGRFRFYVMEAYCWFVLYAFERDPIRADLYRQEVVERLQLSGDGRSLVEFLREADLPNLITDLMMMMMMARYVDVSLPAVEEALPELYRIGLDDPNRPPALQIPLAWLAGQVGLSGGPSLAELRPQGMLRARPREATQKMRDVYYFTHEIFGLSDYGLRRVRFAPEEQAYLERVLPFWSLLHAILNLPDPGAEIAICHQVAGTTHTYGYGEGLLQLLQVQTEEGAFGESRVESPRPMDVRLGYLHTTMVGLHALLGHEALLLRGDLPGLPRAD